MKAGYTALNFTRIKEKCVIILATVAIYVCFESAENTPNMNIKLFFAYKKIFHGVFRSVSLPDGTIFKYESKLTCCN